MQSDLSHIRQLDENDQIPEDIVPGPQPETQLLSRSVAYEAPTRLSESRLVFWTAAPIERVVSNRGPYIPSSAGRVLFNAILHCV